MTVHGDNLQPDVRSVLAVLKICDIEHTFAALTEVKGTSDPVLALGKTCPIIVLPSGKRCLGATHEVLMEASQKDQRMQPKKNDKGVKVAYKGANIPKLYDVKMEKPVRILMEWYTSKLKPHSQNLYQTVMMAIVKEAEISKKMQTEAN